MKRLVLLRFHGSLPVCRNRAGLLRLFNPDALICGLYGGDEGELPAVRRRLSGAFASIRAIPGRTPRWKWQHGDLAVAAWFREHGHEFPFDVLHVLEWDLLLLDALDHLHRGVPAGAVGLTRLRPVREVEASWSWTARAGKREEWERLLGHVRGRFGYRGEPWACRAAGACLPRAFLEAYSGEAVPELGNDELRLPLYAQCLGFPVVDSGLVDASRPDAARFFRLDDLDVAGGDIGAEQGKLGGVRVFHPYRKVWSDLVEPARAYNALRGARDLAAGLAGRLRASRGRGKYRR